MSYVNSFDGVFFLSLATMIFGFCGVALGFALKSKCSSVKCCGCIEIDRNVELEADIEENTIQRQLPIDTIPTMPMITPQRTPRRSYDLSQIAKTALEAESKVQEINFSKSMMSSNK